MDINASVEFVREDEDARVVHSAKKRRLEQTLREVGTFFASVPSDEEEGLR